MFEFKKKLKYNIGDVVFALASNKISEVKIRSIQIVISQREEVKYIAINIDSLLNIQRDYREYQLFSSKEELLNSL